MTSGTDSAGQGDPSPDDDWVLAYSGMIRAATSNSGRVLELGCGSGRDTRHLASVTRVVALDVDPGSLRECHARAPDAALVRADLSQGLPFGDRTFPAVIASLSLHYFSWTTTLSLVREIHRVMRPDGLLVVRVNSTRDANFGAAGHPEIEPNFYRVREQSKRFFDRQAIATIFGNNEFWHMKSVEEQAIMRYSKPKWIWRIALRARPAG